MLGRERKQPHSLCQPQCSCSRHRVTPPTTPRRTSRRPGTHAEGRAGSSCEPATVHNECISCIYTFRPLFVKFVFFLVRFVITSHMRWTASLGYIADMKILGSGSFCKY